MTPEGWAAKDEVYAILADLQRRMENIELYLCGGREGVAKAASRIVTRPEADPS